HPFTAIAPAVATVASLVEGVGAECQVRFGLEQVTDDVRSGAGVDVVHDLRAFVAHPLVGFELRRSLHCGHKVDANRGALEGSPIQERWNRAGGRLRIEWDKSSTVVPAVAGWNSPVVQRPR